MAAAKLYCDELVLEIILRLPLKHAIQCKTLNKNFYDHISDPTFTHKHALISSSRIDKTTLFYSTMNACPKLYTNLPGNDTITLFNGPSVLASCNGLLLLSIKIPSKLLETIYCVFNPITGQALFIYHPKEYADHGSMAGPPGLAVDLGDNKANFRHPFKLVITNKTQNKLIFEVIVPSGCSTRVKSRVDFVCDTFTWLKEKTIRPVYLNGNLHWLGADLRQILVFDVEKEQAKIIDGPIIPNHGLVSTTKTWFGLAQGSFSYVYTVNEEIGIYLYDYANDEWEIRHKINVNVIDPKNVGGPVYFDGENLFFDLKWKMYAHTKISTKRWEKKEITWTWWFSRRLETFIRYSPTLARVFDDDNDDDDDRHNDNYKGLKIKGWSDDGISTFCYSKMDSIDYENLVQLQKFLTRNH